MYTKIKHLFPSFLKVFLRKIIFYARKIYYTGNEYYCPICNKFARKFMKYGKNNDPIKKYKGIGYQINYLCIQPSYHS